MIEVGPGTVRAFGHPGAVGFGTAQFPGEAAPVQEQNDLFAETQPLAHGGDQFRCEQRILALVVGVEPFGQMQIDHMDLGQQGVFRAAG
ncbi:hypothetical protein SDC9_115225 [bioreactor metagenome]|uniref:Uncharacterized protein n=1 Tax=bioreactor metagenome TaxID=1076179 RepID=A0A645C2U5_9ZZZZ